MATPNEAEFVQSMAKMVADQVPRLFSIVLVHGKHIDAEIVAWGMALDGSAYMITVDGGGQYVLANAETL